ncbi:MAG: CHAT domain-containing protein [Cyclobacteriaceae bacterium]
MISLSFFMLIVCQLAALSQINKGNLSPGRAYNKIYREKDPASLKCALEEYIIHFQNRNLHEPVILFKMLLAEQHEKSGNFTGAEKYLTDAYEEVKRQMPLKGTQFYLISGKTQKTIFDPIDRLGYFYLTTGNLRKADQLFRESQTMRNAFFPTKSVHRIHPVIGLGSLYFKKGNFDATYRYFNQAQTMLNQATTTGYNFDNLNRLFLNDLAEICLILGKDREALKYINQLAIASSGSGKYNSRIASNLEVARIFEMKARYFLAKKDFGRTREYLNKANHYNPTSLAGSGVKFRLVKTEAMLNWCQGNTNEATSAFKNLVTLYRRHIAGNFVSMSEYEKEQFYNTLKNDFDLFNAFVLENPSLYEELYDNVLNTKGLLLNETNRLKNRIVESGDQNLIDKLRQWETSKALLSARYFDKNSPSEIETLERKIETLEKEINAGSGLFQSKENPSAWQAVKASLKAGEAAIEILRINTFDKTKIENINRRNGLTDSAVYIALIVTPGSPRPEGLILKDGNRMENRALAFYRNSIFARVDDKLSYDQFWKPIHNSLQGIQRIYLSPDGVFNQINLNTLKNPLTNKYLLDEVDLVYMTNTGDLLRTRKSTSEKHAVLVGRPAFDFNTSDKMNPDIKSIEYGVRNVLNEELLNFREQQFSDLPGTEKEVSAIRSVLVDKHLDVTNYTGVDAREENVKSVRYPLILHIATHGFFVGDTANAVNPMIRSGLVLAGVQNKTEGVGEDGILTAYEATTLNLEGTNLVVLSACETGIGEVRNGQGVYGLQRAIIVAGANNLVMSLWKVDDEATSKLMTDFYRRWSEGDNHKAFSDAQKALREKYPEPFYWGAFVILGK